MTEPSFGEIALDGLWRNNPGLVQLLGLCPLLAVTGTAINGLGLGLATMFTLAVSSVTVSLCRPWLRDEIRIPVFVLIIATVVTTIELIMNAYFHALYTMLGIFIPLIVTNCTIIARAEAFASKTDVRRAFVDALFMGVGFTAVLVVLGGLRELVAHGTVLGDAELLFGAGASGLSWTLIDYRGFLLAALPPGAFIGLGLLVALKNLIDRRLDQRVARRVRAATPVGIGGG